MASLSGEVTDLLIELASAFQKVGMYPDGHPALAPAIEAVESRLAAVLATRRTLALGVGRDELLVEGVSTDSSHPLFKNLATRLYRHELGALIFAEGVTSEEIAQVLRLVSVDPERTGRPVGSESEQVLRGRPHIRLEPARYAELKLDTQSTLSKVERQAEERNLWRALADAALFAIGGGARDVTELFRHGGEDAADDVLEADELARRLSECADDVEFNRAMGRQMAAIARNLATLDPDEHSVLRDRFTELLVGLDPGTLRRLLSMGGDDRARRQFLLDAVRGVGADAVMTLIRAASEESSSDISRWMLRLLTKMAAHSGDGIRSMRSRARSALREQVTALLTDWDLDNPNPEDYERALGSLARHSPESGGGSETFAGIEAERIAQISLETGVDSDILADAVDALVNAGRTRDLVRWLDRAPGHGAANPAALHIWDRLAEPAVVRRLVEEEQPDYDTLDRILPLAGLSAAEALLDRLATADNISLRRRMFDRVAALGPAAGPLAMQRLENPEHTPWFVLRNMLVLMGALPRWPAEFDPSRLRAHENAQVRFEALKLCMRLSHLRPDAVLAALRDEVGRIQALGVVEAEAGAPAEAEPCLRAVATSPDEDTELRLPAIRALGRLRTDSARETLIELLDVKHTRFRRRELGASCEKLAALRTLVAWWPSDDAVREIVDAARTSGDPAVAEAVARPPRGGTP